MEKTSSGCYIIDDNYNVVSVNKTAQALYPQLKPGAKCYKCLLDLDAPCGPCPVAAGRKGPCTYVDPIRKITEVVDAVEVEIEGHGTCHALVFSTVGKNEDFAASLPLSADELTDLALIKALTADYSDVFSLHIPSGKITLYRQNSRPVSAENYYRNDVSYRDGINEYVKRYVIEEDRDVFLMQNSIEYIEESLRKSEFIINHYRVRLGGELHYYYRKISRVGEPENYTEIVVGVGCEDAQVLERKRRKELEKKLAKVEYDSLTDLYTREAFILRSEQLMKKYPELHFDFCICRVDNLGMINHQYGSAMGDKILSLIGSLLFQRTTDDNCIGYLGDGVFVSFTPTDPKDIREAAVMEFRDEIFRQSEIHEISLKWSIYIDVLRELSIDEVIRKTLYALSTIRWNARKDYIEFDQTMIDRMEWENEIENEFETNLENGEFVPYFQPKYSIKTGEPAGAEALARWVRPSGEIVPPDVFIPVLERSGKINLLDEYIFRRTCMLKEKLAKQGVKDYPISVNLSRASLFKKDIAGLYRSIADEHGVERSGLPIEITESAAVRAASIRQFADRLIAYGFPLYMDDFGSGYSSLAVLQTIPFDCIKIDKTLISNIGHDDSEKLLKHTIAFAKECGKLVIAEGVETYEQYMFLKVIGCDMAQGYYFSKPVSEKEYMDLLKAGE